MKTHLKDMSPIYASYILICGLVCAMVCASAQAQSTQAPGSIESALAIEDPTARIAALQKFLETSNISEQSQKAREAIVTSRAQMAESALGENNLERAMENFRRAITELPELVTDRFFDETANRIPFALSARGYRNEAVELARLLEKRFSKEPPKLASLGEFYMTIESAGDAINTLETASKIAGEDARIRRSLGAAYRMGLRLDDAVAEYQLAISFDPKDKRAYYELANLYRAHGAYDDAIKLYRKQLEIEPKHSSSFKGLALAYLAQGNEEQMTAALNQARDLRGSAEEVTGDIYLQTQLAFYYLAQNKLKEAQKAVAAALLIEPRYSWARIAAAEVDLAAGKYFEAERNLIAARSYASFPTLYFTLGKLYLTVEDFDGALEQFSKAFSYSPQGQFTARLGGVFDAQAGALKELLAREHRAAIFLAEPPTTDETFKIAEALVRFDAHARGAKSTTTPSSQIEKGKGDKGKGDKSKTEKGISKNVAPSAETWRRQMEELDQAAMDFIEAESSRRSFRMLAIAERLAQASVATGLAIELAELALGLAEVSTEPDGSLREYPNYDRQGRLAIFRGRALGAKGWALFKAGKNQEAAATLTKSTNAYGSLPEGRRSIWRLATVKETQGELKEALDLYIAGYERPISGFEMDVNRAVIESLYRKVNGSLDGLNQRLGIMAPDAPSGAPINAISAKIPVAAKSKSAISETASKSRPATQSIAPTRPDPFPAPQAAKAVELPKVGDFAPSIPQASLTGFKAILSTLKSVPRRLAGADEDKPSPPSRLIELPTISGAESVIPLAPPVDFNDILSTFDSLPSQLALSDEPAPPPRLIELPTISGAESVIPLASSIDFNAILSTFDGVPLNLTVSDEPPPPPPSPNVHTRKRRVTVPNDQQRDL
ncbi:MAG TPA: tetratricopeptide repeat protein [Blastocatellia bacterium]|nr:tetratricopeptide repeat protein [Blastocatellia bacterium]